jgi:hypothetical protein
MTRDGFALAATIILLFPMGYFLMAAPGFLLVRLDVPPVARLLRGVFGAYFLMMIVVGTVGAIAYAVAGRFGIALCLGGLAAFALWARGWFLQHIDAEISARDAGDADAVRRLRRLHWSGMACNAVQLVAVVASLPYVLVVPT